MHLHKFTQIWVLDTDFSGLGRQATDKEIFLLLPYIPFSRRQIDHCQQTEPDQTFYVLVFYPSVAQVEIKNCIIQKTKHMESFAPRRQTGLSLSLLHEITWTSSFTSFLNTHPTKHSSSGCVGAMVNTSCPLVLHPSLHTALTEDTNRLMNPSHAAVSLWAIINYLWLE